MSGIHFITGTDTGVGKTVVTAHWLHALRARGGKALAMKPFCSGDEKDVRVLQRLQAGEMTREECNPYYFKRALAPGVAAAMEGREIRLGEVVRGIRTRARGCETLLVEGAGGVMVPLGRGFMVLDLMARLKAPVVVVARNRLGTLNHTLLTVAAIKRAGLSKVKVVLAGERRGDGSGGSNGRVLREYLGVEEVLEWPWMGLKPFENKAFAGNLKKVEKVLARIGE